MNALKLFLRSLLFFFFIISLPLHAVEPCSAKNSVERVYAHLLINDAQSALEAAKWGLNAYPLDKSMWMAYLDALAKNTDEKQMLEAWNRFLVLFPDERDNRQLIEAMAWGVILKGFNSSSPITRSMALIAAFFSQDAKGAELIEKALTDQNFILRSMAIQLASHLRDSKLQNKILLLLNRESNWKVRLELIQAVGSMQITEAKAALMDLLADPKSSAEEQAAAIQSLVAMTETVEREEIARLATSDRASLRHLACQLIIHCELGKDVDLIIPLLQDSHAKVRAAGLYALGILDLSTHQAVVSEREIIQHATALLEDPNPSVSITAAWLLTLRKPYFGQAALKRWLEDVDVQNRYLAASALVATGKYGAPLLQQAINQTKEPFVRMNLALGMIYQRTNADQACQVLFEALTQEKGRWMRKEQGPFNVLAPSTIKFSDTIPQYPEVVNQLTRLEVINILAMMKYPSAQEVVLAFLEQKTWGVTGLAAALLLTEGDESALELISPLLEHPSYKVRIQAALILALWGRDEETMDFLQQSYVDANRDIKSKILEGLGRIGSTSSIPFLVKQLEDPSQSLRIIAAASLLQCLYH